MTPPNSEPDAIDLLKALLRSLDPRSDSLALSVLTIPGGLIFILVTTLGGSPAINTKLSLIGGALLFIGFLLYPLKLAQIIKLHLPVYTSFQAYLSALGLLTTIIGLLSGIYSFAFLKQFEGTGILAGIAMCGLAEYLSRRHHQ